MNKYTKWMWWKRSFNTWNKCTIIVKRFRLQSSIYQRHAVYWNCLSSTLNFTQYHELHAIERSIFRFPMIFTNHIVITSVYEILFIFFSLSELPEPLLTTDLLPRFEEAATGQVASQTAQIQELNSLICQLPSCNRTLLIWLLLHFDAIIKNEKTNKMNIQTLAMLLGPTLQMSHRLLVTMLSHCSVLFPGVVLTK